MIPNNWEKDPSIVSFAELRFFIRKVFGIYTVVDFSSILGLSKSLVKDRFAQSQLKSAFSVKQTNSPFPYWDCQPSFFFASTKVSSSFRIYQRMFLKKVHIPQNQKRSVDEIIN